MSNKYSAIIPAAGIGSRMQADIPKQYLKIHGLTILEHTLHVFLEEPIIDQVVVVTHPDDRVFDTLSIAKHTKLHVVAGGEERADSVLAGVAFARTQLNSEWVLVHDAARPGLSTSALRRLISGTSDSSGGILATLSVDTVKQGAGKTIDKTLDRSKIWLAQTPQLFPTNILLHALSDAKKNKLNVTDEASAVEMQGIEVKLIEGEKSNFKITTPDDLVLAEYYLKNGAKI